MRCAKCKASIPWYRAAWISPWTFVRCSACRQRWGRKLDLQAYVVLAFVVVGVLALLRIEMPMALRAALVVAWIAVGMYVDATTIQLVPGRKTAQAARRRHERRAAQRRKSP